VTPPPRTGAPEDHGDEAPSPHSLQLEIVPVGAVEAVDLPWLAHEVESQFPRIRCAVGRAFAPRPEWWMEDAGEGSGRVHADLVLDALIEWHGARTSDPRSHWLLGLTDAALVAPSRPVAFGEATVGGCCAVVGIGGLRARVADRAIERALVRTRVLKVACHELGHLLWLSHCPRATCVMHPSGGVADVDRKLPDLCPECARSAER
jgi:predicted Zn-dependent protease